MTTSVYEANRIARRIDEAMNAAGDPADELIRHLFDCLEIGQKIEDPDTYEGWLIPEHLCPRLREAFSR